MRNLLCTALVLATLWLAPAASAVVVNFDDMDYSMTLTGTNYAGLTWEVGSKGYVGKVGFWSIGGLQGSYVNSPPRNVVNAWGSPFIGIGFPGLVDVEGAFFAAQGTGGSSDWAKAVRVHGYRSGTEVGVTDWFRDIDTIPDWFAMNLKSVDRIVIEAIPGADGGGWYGMDDLTYQPVPEPSSLLALATGILAISGAVRRRHS